MQRRTVLQSLAKGLIIAPVAASGLLASCASTPQGAATDVPNSQPDQTYTQDEIVASVSGFFGMTAAAVGGAIEKLFSDNGRPNAYIKGEEGSGALVVGARYGQGQLQMKSGDTREVYWQGPSIGFDAGGNASKVFTLIYRLPNPDDIYQRFPGVEGTAYFIGGVGVNYQEANGIRLAPMRAGLGFRAGANIGDLVYSRQRNILPF
jgi:hypothetical protein